MSWQTAEHILQLLGALLIRCLEIVCKELFGTCSGLNGSCKIYVRNLSLQYARIYIMHQYTVIRVYMNNMHYYMERSTFGKYDKHIKNGRNPALVWRHLYRTVLSRNPSWRLLQHALLCAYIIRQGWDFLEQKVAASPRHQDKWGSKAVPGAFAPESGSVTSSSPKPQNAVELNMQ